MSSDGRVCPLTFGVSWQSRPRLYSSASTHTRTHTHMLVTAQSSQQRCVLHLANDDNELTVQSTSHRPSRLSTAAPMPRLISCYGRPM